MQRSWKHSKMESSKGKRGWTNEVADSERYGITAYGRSEQHLKKW